GEMTEKVANGSEIDGSLDTYGVQTAPSYGPCPPVAVKGPNALNVPVAPYHSPLPPTIVSSSENSPAPVVWSTIASLVSSEPAAVVKALSPVNSTPPVVGVSTVGMRLDPVNTEVPAILPLYTPVAHTPTGDRQAGPLTG